MDEAIAEPTECSVSEDGKHVTPCSTLASFVEGPAAFSKTKGLHVWSMRNFKTRERTRTFYGFKNMGPEPHRKNGMAINFCPFCGVKIDTPFNDDDE